MRAVRLASEHVELRAFRASELDAVVAAHRSPDDDLGIARTASRAKLRRRIERSGRWDRGFIEFAIVSGGRLVGDLQARGYPRMMAPPGVVEIGISLYDRADRSHGVGTEALRLFTDWLLGPGGIDRVQASTSVKNKAMQRVLEKLGYRREGVLRGFMPENGTRTDYVMYAKVKRPKR